MEYLLPELSEQLKKEYNLDDIKIIKNKYVSDYYSVFIKMVVNKDTCERLNSRIAIELSPILKSDYERWNVYLFFLFSNTISDTLRHKIEHNKFSSRKIVEDNFDKGLDETSITQLLEKHIINLDLDLNEIQNNYPILENSSYQSDSYVYKLIENSKLKVSDKTFKEDICNLYEQIKKEA